VRSAKMHTTMIVRPLGIALVLLLALGFSPLAVHAGTFQPVTVTDQTQTAPLSSPTPSAYEPRYVSGFGLDDSFTVFFEDRPSQQIYYVSTTTGAVGFPTAATLTNIVDTHFVVKDWPITIGGTTYAYRGWGSVDNDPNHKFYVSNDLTNWTLVSTFQVPNAAGFYGGGCYVYYGWHDVIELNGTYYAFGESNCSHTFLVRSDNGDDVWEAFDSVGGVAGYGPLELPSGVTAGWTPRGNFIDLGHDRGYGKLYVDPNDNNFYLAVNTAANASLDPDDLEAAFIDPDNWTWHDGTTGPAANPIISATAEHDLRECWVVPNSDPDADWVVIYDADFGLTDGDKAVGWATLKPPSVPPSEVWVDDDYDEAGCAAAGHEWQYDCFDVVQDGIGAVAADGTVHVAAGTYVETGQIVINKNVSVLGADRATTIIKPAQDTGSSDDARGWWLIQAGYELDLSGVTLDGTGYKVYQGLRFVGHGSIDDVSFTEIKYNPSGPTYAGLAVVAFGDGPVDISDSTFSQIGRVGVLYYGTGVSGSTFDGNTYTGKGTGDWLDYALDISAGADIEVTNNTISGNRGVASSDGSTSAGVLVTTYYAPTTHATLTGNTITNSTVGIAVGYDDSDTSVVVAHGNSIYDNDYGISTTAPAVDAEDNWWGSVNGPAHSSNTFNVGAQGNTVEDGIDFCPWLDAAPPTGVSFAPVTTDTPAGQHSSIQAGVDFATGGNVAAVAGTFTEQVEIAKNLTVDGAGSGTILLSPDTLTKYFTTGSNNNYPVIYIHDADGVTVQELVVDGAGKGNANYRFVGIAFRNAGGTLQNCTIKDIRDTPFSGAQHGVAIYAYNTDETARTINVWDSEVTGFQKNAMALIGTNLTVNVSGNTVTGAGPTTVTAQNGIQVDLAGGTVGPSNNVSNVSYTGANWTASGILVQYAGVDVTDNTVSECQTAIYNWGGNGTISGNAITASTAGTGTSGHYGIIAADPPLVLPSPFGTTEAGADLSAAASGVAGTLGTVTISVEDNDLAGDGISSDSIGLWVAAGYDDNDLSFSATGNDITDWGYGVVEEKCTEDCGAGTVAALHVNGNCISGSTQYGLYAQGFTSDIDATNNWWGDVTGPYHPTQNPGGLGDEVSDYVAFVPWSDACGGSPTAVFQNVRTGGYYTLLQDAVDDAASGDTILTIGPGPFAGEQHATVTTSGVTIKLNGRTFGPGSPWLTVNADDVAVKGPGVIDGWTGSANSTDPAIRVLAGADNFILKGAEIKRWADGVSLEGSVISFKMGENFIHNNTTSGLVVLGSGTTLSGIVTIEGNLFKDNGGPGIVHNGVGTLPATYNSWGDLAGPTGPLGDGVGTNVTYIPWTFAEIYFDMEPLTVFVESLEPSWTAPGGGGVFSAYIGPPDYDYVSPGSTAVYDGREAGIIKAGLTPDPDDGHYWDEGLFAFKPTITIDEFAASTLSYEVVNQAGVNPVWMTIEIDTGVVGDRGDNTTYQHVPTTNPAGWHTVDAAAGLWQKWNDDMGDTSGNPLISLGDVATAHTGCNVVRAYLRLGMGDSYNNGGTGTIGWVDKAVIGGVTYDFVVSGREEVVRHVLEGTEFDVELEADAAKLYGLTFQFTYDTAKLTLGPITFAAPWAGRCTVLPGLPSNTVGYFCNLLNEATPDPEWDADGGTIATFHFTAFTGTPGNGPWTALFDISHLEADTGASAIGGQKVFVNNAGFNDATIMPDRDITDADDGQIIIERGANYTGFVHLQGRLEDTAAVCRVWSQAAKAGAVELANGTSASSGAYTTAHLPPNWLVIDNTYYLTIDRWLFLTTTPTAESSFRHSRLLDSYPTTALPDVSLLGGDATNDEVILVTDLSCIGGDYGKTSGFTACGGTGLSDVNEDGLVNVQDLSLCGGNLYKTFSPWTVP
jgi:hypothetical protein